MTWRSNPEHRKKQWLWTRSGWPTAYRNCPYSGTQRIQRSSTRRTGAGLQSIQFALRSLDKLADEQRDRLARAERNCRTTVRKLRSPHQQPRPQVVHRISQRTASPGRRIRTPWKFTDDPRRCADRSGNKPESREDGRRTAVQPDTLDRLDLVHSPLRNDVVGVKIRQERPDPIQTSGCTMLVFGNWVWT
jgi:hypothetical protein